MERKLDEMLERLQTDHIDFLLLHSLDRKRFDYGKELGALKFLDKALEQGKILHPAFSMHDNIESFKSVSYTHLGAVYGRAAPHRSAGRHAPCAGGLRHDQALLLQALRTGDLSPHRRAGGAALPLSLIHICGSAPAHHQPQPKAHGRPAIDAGEHGVLAKRHLGDQVGGRA